jgi:hypothetical protein
METNHISCYCGKPYKPIYIRCQYCILSIEKNVNIPFCKRCKKTKKYLCPKKCPHCAHLNTQEINPVTTT